MSISQPVDLSSLTVEELKALKKRWYGEARAHGMLSAVARVVRVLGTAHPKKHGAIWRWDGDGVSIWLDDWTGSFGADSGGSQVCYVSHFGDHAGVFVPGPWVDVVLKANVDAQVKVTLREGKRALDEKAALLRQLAPGCQVCGEPHGVSVPCGDRRAAP